MVFRQLTAGSLDGGCETLFAQQQTQDLFTCGKMYPTGCGPGR